MTTTTLTRGAGTRVHEIYGQSGDTAKPRRSSLVTYARQSGGTATKLVHEDVPIFRSGTFKNSWGESAEWTKLHMEQFVQHFNFLRDSGSFGDVPVRKSHPSPFTNPMDEIVGHFTAMRTEDMVSPVDGVTYTYLLADYEVLDETAIEKIEIGLWRNRSSEVGEFETNAGALYFPVMMGFAFVDIPAVEGLHLNGHTKSANRAEFAKIDREPTVAKSGSTAPVPNQGAGAEPGAFKLGDDPIVAPEAPKAPETPAAEATPESPTTGEPVRETLEGSAGTGASTGTAETVVVAPVPVPEPYVPGVDGNDEGLPITTPLSQPPIGPPVEAAAPAVPPVTPAPTTESGGIPVTENPQGPIIPGGTFSLGGRPAAFYSAKVLQEYINSLEANISAHEKKSKVDFCNKLAAEGKITATQLDATIAFATALPSDQYSAWSALQASAPQAALFGMHGQTTQADGSAAAATLRNEYEIKRDIVKNLKGAMSTDQLLKTSAYTSMISLAGQLNIECDMAVKA